MTHEPAKPAAQAGGSPPPEPVKFEPKELVDFRETVEWLADQSESDRSYWLPKKAEALGKDEKELRSTVNRVLRDRALQTAARRLEEDRAAKQQAEAAAQKQREDDLLHKKKKRDRQEADKSKAAEAAAEKAAEVKAERERRKAELKAEREERRAEKEAEKRAKEKAKGFATLSKLPVDRHAAELEKLAKRLDEEPAALREEFEEFLGVELGAATSKEIVEPWPESVDVAAVLGELGDKISKYIVMQTHLWTAAVLWSAHTWLYDHGIVTHSPILAVTSPEPISGKSELIAVLGRATPRFSLNIEMTGPSLYRYVDAVKPTLGLDEADDLFVRKSDLKHIVNAGWTRGAKVPRQVNINGVSTTVFFDPFTPKMIALLGSNLPPATRTRCIELRMRPKREDETVEAFSHLDDAEFAILRRKFCRFAADNAAALREAKPTTPAGMNSRAAANWKLLLATAELAGGSWPKQAREAAERLTRSGRRPSDGVQLLTAFGNVFIETGRDITSEAMVTELRKDPTAIWADYNHGGPITQRQVAILLDAYDIHPVPLHPTRRKDFSRQGYKLAQFVDAFAQYLPDHPIIQSWVMKKAKRR
jgi:chemotaxis protein histidine kinase CheA